MLPLGDDAGRWLEDKGVSVEDAARFGLYSATVDHEGAMQPDERGDVLAIPFNQGDRPVGYQFRRSGDRGQTEFKHTGQRTFFNVDAVDKAIEANKGLLIVGGPIDTLACIKAGVESVVGMPDAPIGEGYKSKEDKDLDSDPLFLWLAPLLPKLRKVRRVVLALGSSEGSQRLRDELARRIGRARCSIAALPDDKRDIGDVLAAGGDRDALRDIVRHAKPIPVSGLYKMTDYVPTERQFLETGFRSLDGIVKLYRGAFVIVSGLPMSGKSLFTDQLAFNMTTYHGWNCAFATFEEDPDPDLKRKLRHYFLEKPRNSWTDNDIAEADAYIEKHFSFITRDPTGNDDDDITVDWLAARIEDAVVRYNISMAVVDPWNELDHRKLPGEQRDEYINRALRKLKDTCKRLDVCLVIVAHPTKEAHKDKDNRPMTLSDISDGAAWANKAEIGLIVYRVTHNDTVTEIFTRKVKFRGGGTLSKAMLYFQDEIEMFGSN